MESCYSVSCDDISQIKTGDLLAWGHSPGSHESIWITLVRLATMSEFGHVSVAWQRPDGLHHIEAVIPRIRVVKVPIDKSFYVVKLSKLIDVPDMSFFDDKINSKYGILDAIRAYIGMTTAKDNRYQCAELADEFYQANGINLSPSSLTPSNLVRAAMDLSDLHKLKPCTVR